MTRLVPCLADLHPAPAENRVDHRDAANRDQSRWPDEMQSIWVRAVEHIANELQIEPIEAHFLLVDGCDSFTKGLALRRWDWE